MREGGKGEGREDFTPTCCPVGITAVMMRSNPYDESTNCGQHYVIMDYAQSAGIIF